MTTRRSPPDGRVGSGDSDKRGRIELSGLSLTTPPGGDQIDEWCDRLDLEPARVEPPRDTPGVGAVCASSLRRGDGDTPGIAYLSATTDDLNAAVIRLQRAGHRLITPAERGPEGLVAVVLGPASVPLRLVQPMPTASQTVQSGTLRAEEYLLRSLGFSAVALALLAGFLAHLLMEGAPHGQVSFAFLIGATASFAGLGTILGYPAEVLAGQDDLDTARTKVTPTEAASSTGDDPAGGWAHWRAGLQAAVAAAVGSGLVVALAAFALVGRPVGFWLLWGWMAAIGGSASAIAAATGRRRGLLSAGRRALGQATDFKKPTPLLRRVWLQGALPVAVANGVGNGLLAWTIYRFGVTSHQMSSETTSAVVIVAVFSWLLGRQWGRADWNGGRILVPAGLGLPSKVRLGPQGAAFGVVGELILLALIAHAVPAAPGAVGAAVFRGLGVALAGGVVFALGAVAGALGAQADEREEEGKEEIS